MRAPRGAVFIDRGSPWGNPYIIGRHGDRDQCVDRYWQWLRVKLRQDPAFLESLRGKDLACHCSPLRCHGEAILYYLRTRVRVEGELGQYRCNVPACNRHWLGYGQSSCPAHGRASSQRVKSLSVTWVNPAHDMHVDNA